MSSNGVMIVEDGALVRVMDVLEARLRLGRNSCATSGSAKPGRRGEVAI